MRTVYTRDGVRMVRDLLTGEKVDYWTHICDVLNRRAKWLAPQTPVGPTCDGVKRWAYQPTRRQWWLGRSGVGERCPAGYVWVTLDAPSGIPWTGTARTLHQAKKAAERAAKGDDHA